MNQRHAMAYRCLAVALAHLGREAEARETVARLLELEPNFRISEWTGGRWQSQASIDGLRKAGFRNDRLPAVLASAIPLSRISS